MQDAMTAQQRMAAKALMHGATLLGHATLMVFVIFLFWGPFDLVDMKLSVKALLVWDILLSFLFFSQHSVMVRRRFRAAMAHRIPEQFHAAVFALASSAVLAVFLLFWQPSHIAVFNLRGALRWAARVLFLAAAVGEGWGVLSLAGFDPFGVEAIKAHLSGRPARMYPFTVKGPYLWVRHPLYFFVLVMVWTCPDLTLDRLAFNLLWSAWIFIATVLEERDLVSDFGDEYRQYQRRVPMLIPWKRSVHGPHSIKRGV